MYIDTVRSTAMDVDDLDDVLRAFEVTLNRLGFKCRWWDDHMMGYAIKYGVLSE